jgi:hypothetical protein
MMNGLSLVRSRLSSASGIRQPSIHRKQNPCHQRPAPDPARNGDVFAQPRRDKSVF